MVFLLVSLSARDAKHPGIHTVREALLTPPLPSSSRSDLCLGLAQHFDAVIRRLEGALPNPAGSQGGQKELRIGYAELREALVADGIVDSL